VHGEATKSQKAIDSTHEWGSTIEERRPVLDRNELSKTPLEEGGGGCIRGVWGGQDPLVTTLVGQDKIHGPKDQRQWRNTETGSGHQLVEYFPVNS
jgi:hypothetical protein